ncbi:MAG: type V CRISPR-associated protein Cas12k [Crocosphaera sp.]|nr:type V CRISPR-associated protein Cas12k [Crocosphaera sp.]
MKLKTIECRLYAPSDTLRYLWLLMEQKNTPLINEIINHLSEHSDFDKWFKAKQIPKSAIKSICNDLKSQDIYQNQPGRFYTSAVALIHYMFKSWFAIQRQLQRRLEGKQRWFNLFKSDQELEQDCGQSLDIIINKAEAILKSIDSKEIKSSQKPKKTKKRNKKRKSSSEEAITLFDRLFKTYNEATDSLERCALTYLLKNNGEIPDEDEDLEKFALRKRKKEIEIERLQQQLENRIPLGRDLTGELWQEMLITVNESIPKDENEASAWQAKLLKKSHNIPYPVAYESNTDFTWSKDSRGHLLVTFNGLVESLKKLQLNPEFEIRCDRRHLPWFQRFWEDQEIKSSNNNKHSSALFVLRSARLLWREEQGKGDPWNIHTLYLQCSVETQLWTEAGTKQVQTEKMADLKSNRLRMKPELTFPFFFRSQSLSTYLNLWKIITSYRILKFLEKGDFIKAQKDFQDSIKRTESCLKNLQSSYSRSQKSLYQGNPEIIVGVAMGLSQPATLAVVNVVTQEVLTYRSLKQLLGKNYNLFNRQRQQKQKLSHQRHKAQKKDAPNQYGDSELGQYVDRLIAKAIVEVAKEYQAHSIAVPKIRQIREITQSEVQARAERKIQGYKKGQKKYAQQYRENIHQWSYSRLIESIHQASAKFSITVEIASQSYQESFREQAKNLAIAAYLTRFEKIG